MAYSSGIEIIVSKTIEYMRHRLSAEQISSMDLQLKTFEDTDKIIEHMRSRLKSSSQEQCRKRFAYDDQSHACEVGMRVP